MGTDDLDTSAFQQGEAQTLRDVIGALERDGYRAQFGAREGGVVRCFTCRHDAAASNVKTAVIRRLEGASDPDDMLAVVAMTCPHCGATGTLVLAFGPEASIADSEVLAALPEPAHAPPTSQGE